MSRWYVFYFHFPGGVGVGGGSLVVVILVEHVVILYKHWKQKYAFVILVAHL